MKSFVKKDLLLKKREEALQKNLKKRKNNKILIKKKVCQYSQINGLKKQLKQKV